MSLNHDQAAAAASVQAAIQERRIMALRGAAGTGKTYTLQNCLPEGAEVLLIAPTHKALAVAQGSLPQCEARTLASALGMRLMRDKLIQARPHRIRGYDAVIVDEASMVDSDLYLKLVHACAETNTALIWVGDPAQLPPVGEDESPVFSRVQEQAVLNNIVRQAEGNPIIEASVKIRRNLEAGRRTTLDELSQYAGGAFVISRGNPYTPAEYCIDAVRRGLEARTIAFTNAAVDRSAKLVINALHPKGSLPYIEGDQIFAGAPMYDDTLKKAVFHNNEEGIIRSCKLHDDGYSLWVEIDFDCSGRVECKTPIDGAAHREKIRLTKQRKYAAAKKAKYSQTSAEQTAWVQKVAQIERELDTLAEWADLRYCYSSTAHKSQGSTFDAAIVDWPDIQKQRDDALFNRLLYVAITRPSEFLVIVDY